MNTTPKMQQELINQLAIKLREIGIIHLNTDGILGNGKFIRINERKLINFSSCSYLGLETDQRLKQAAIKAIDDYGVHLSSSRAYVSIDLYNELESNLSKIFGYPSVVFASTTLAHMSLMPLYMDNRDTVIMDHQVHSSIKFNIKGTGIKPENLSVVRHNRMDYLEDRIKKFKDTSRKVWYLADGVYSMYGDTAPLKDLIALQEKYDNFYLYLDDAHGMSWMGDKGSGFILSEIELNERIVMVTSLGKGFGTGGAAVVCHDEGMKEYVRNCAGSLIFGGPIEPPTLGAALVSSRIHLTDEITEKQLGLRSKIDYLYNNAKKLDLPMINTGETPLFYFGLGKPEVGFSIVDTLMNNGIFPNIAIYPSVPYNNTGLRVMVNSHHDYADLDRLLEVISANLYPALEKENHSIDKIYQAFGKIRLVQN